ncbi:Glycolipid transfer protein 1 [Zea mays]|uniref:Glycolipid transfer protein 1 n=3 Tax=Zea mays TaxID=4577 RepID=A0A1D6Q588_MAIZE|nr:Glycolipid transfer protein 1 [Zea mays]AQK53707.1 Glycolipid transfer protein 1 [Zea mays]
MAQTVFTPSLEAMKHVKAENGVILTKPFLDVCKQILPVLVQKFSGRVGEMDGLELFSQDTPCFYGPDKFGGAMAIVKSDIGGNITRLENKYTSEPSKYEHLYSMVQEEVQNKTAKGSSSCTNGLLWLTRAMDFLVELFRNLLEHPDWTMGQSCTDSYTKTLKKFHGWLASSSFTVAMKLAPNREKFMEVISGTGDINADIEKFCTTFSPFLKENHNFLASVGLDDLKAS